MIAENLYFAEGYGYNNILFDASSFFLKYILQISQWNKFISILKDLRSRMHTLYSKKLSY